MLEQLSPAQHSVLLLQLLPVDPQHLPPVQVPSQQSAEVAQEAPFLAQHFPDQLQSPLQHSASWVQFMPVVLQHL